MSVFEGEQPDNNPLEALVGEGKKFKTVEDLAKSKLESDNHIARIQAENDELRRKVLESQTVEDILARIEAGRQTPPVPNPNPSPEAHQPAKPDGNEVNLQAEIQRVLQESKTQERVQTNVAEVTRVLVERFGDETKANEYIKSRASELGVGVEFLQEVATKSPKAFFTTVGLDAQPPAPNNRPSQGDVNPQALKNHSPGVQPKTYKWWDSLRKENPTAYFSEKMTMQRHKEALEAGEAFFT